MVLQSKGRSAYMDKAARVEVVLQIFWIKDIFRERLEHNLAEKNRCLKNYMIVPISADDIF